jgi:transposase
VDEAESESLAHRIAELYGRLHASDNLRTIPGVGEHTAPIFLAAVGDSTRFRNQSAFANWEGVVPGARQSSNVEAKGLRMTKAGPSIMRMALYQAGEIARRCDPQLASVYYREMVHHGKNHRQSMGAVMSHLGARVLSVLKENKPYELRDAQGKLITRKEAAELIRTQYKVPEATRQERRRSKREVGRPSSPRKHEAAEAPQPGPLLTPQ